MSENIKKIIYIVLIIVIGIGLGVLANHFSMPGLYDTAIYSFGYIYLS